MKRAVVLSIHGAALALLTQGCSLVFPTEDLLGSGGSASGGGGSTAQTSGDGGDDGGGGGGTGAQGPGGGPPCPCEERDDILWMVAAEETLLGSPPPACPAGSSIGDGYAFGSLGNQAATCEAECDPACSLKIGRTESVGPNCTVSGDTVLGDDMCHPVTLSTINGDDFAIYVATRGCTVTGAPFVERVTATRLNVCEPDEDSCSLGAETTRCIPKVGPACDSCFPQVRAAYPLADERSCEGVISTCDAPCIGDLRRFEDSLCTDLHDGGFEYSLADDHICPADPAVEENGTPTYWRFAWEGEPCTAVANAMGGSLSLGDPLEEYCCER